MHQAEKNRRQRRDVVSAIVVLEMVDLAFRVHSLECARALHSDPADDVEARFASRVWDSHGAMLLRAMSIRRPLGSAAGRRGAGLREV